MDARTLIDMLGLTPLPVEGGYFVETYRCDEVIGASALDGRYGRDKALSTAIYYLLTPESFSLMHRLRSDEVFHFYAGDPVEMLQLLPDGSHARTLIGGDIEAGQTPQWVVRRGVWQGCRLAPGGLCPLFVSPFWEGHRKASLLISSHLSQRAPTRIWSYACAKVWSRHEKLVILPVACSAITSYPVGSQAWVSIRGRSGAAHFHHQTGED